MKLTDLKEDTYTDVPTLLTVAKSRTKSTSWLTVLDHIRKNAEIADKNGTMYTVFTVPKLDERLKQFKTDIIAALSAINDPVQTLEYVNILLSAGVKWPELKTLYTANYDKSFKLLANELAKKATLWVGYNTLKDFFAVIDKIMYLKLVPDIKPILNTLAPKLLKSLNLIIADGYIQNAIPTYNKLKDLGLQMPGSLPDMVNARKDAILKGMLKHIKHAYNDRFYNPAYELSRIKHYQELGINWPELTVIHNSLISKQKEHNTAMDNIYNAVMAGRNENN